MRHAARAREHRAGRLSGDRGPRHSAGANLNLTGRGREEDVAKSSRQKKRDRAKAEARKAERSRLRSRAERERRTRERIARMIDPQTGPAEVAELLTAEGLDPLRTGGVVMTRAESGAPAGDIDQIARTLLADQPEPPAAWVSVVAGWAAHLADDEDACASRRQEVIAWAGTAGESPADDDDDGSLRRAQAASIALLMGHSGQGCELLDPQVREHPDDMLARELHAAGLASAYRATHPGDRTDDKDPPGGFKPGPAERAALDRFADRSGLDALEEAIRSFLDRTEAGKRVREHVDAECSEGAADYWTQADRDLFGALMLERSIKIPIPGAGEEDNVLRALAADPATPPELAARARAWDEHARYGAWQVPDPVPAPGVRCTDLVSGARRYAQFPPDILEGAAPWGVWLGVLVPVDGIWRSTGNGLWLSPAEGDAIAEAMEEAALRVALVAAGAKDEEIPQFRGVRFGQAAPYCVRWDNDDEPEPQFGALYSGVMAGMIPPMAAQAWWKRSQPMTVTNTSGDTMVLTDATIEVADGTDDMLLEYHDFGLEVDGVDGQIVWWGDEPDENDERTIFGRLTPEPGRLVARVNSRERLRELVTILTDLGTRPKITDERHCDPSPDFAWGPVPSLAADGPVDKRVWEERWLDLPVVSLEFCTPWEAAQGDEDERLKVEALLRQLEYQSAASERGIDVPWLRAELGLPRLSTRTVRRLSVSSRACPVAGEGQQLLDLPAAAPPAEQAEYPASQVPRRVPVGERVNRVGFLVLPALPPDEIGETQVQDHRVDGHHDHGDDDKQAEQEQGDRRGGRRLPVGPDEADGEEQHHAAHKAEAGRPGPAATAMKQPDPGGRPVAAAGPGQQNR